MTRRAEIKRQTTEVTITGHLDLDGTGSGVIETDDLIIDAKSGVSGAGRSLKQNILFCETGEGISPYAIAAHRHAVQTGRAAGRQVSPHRHPAL